MTSTVDEVVTWAARRLGRLRERFARLGRLRERFALLDHLWRAAQRYDKENGSRLAAAIAYYGFFATFALGVLMFVILGAVSAHNRTAEDAAQAYLQQTLPLSNLDAVVEASRKIGLIALVALPFSGIWWVESLRSSQRALWCLNQHPGHILVRYLVDLAVLVGLGLLLLISLGISLGLQDILLWLAGDEARPLARHALDWSSALLGTAVDFVLSAALLVAAPRLRIPARRLLPATLFIVIGLALLKTAGRWYVDLMTSNPAYRVAAGAIGLLVFMYLFNQITLFATAFAATSTHGTVLDLAKGRPPSETADSTP